jgi:cell wall-associated NlpC family hydrolase
MAAATPARILIALFIAALAFAAPAAAEVPGGWATGSNSAAQTPADDQPDNGWIPGDNPLGGGGAADPAIPDAPSGPKPVVPGELAAVGRNGIAYAPKRAPYRVKLVIWAANQLRKKPYKWGGGHGNWRDSGYDCSGSVSYVLHAAGLLGTPQDSRGFTRYGEKGLGRWISIYANDGHVFMVVAGVRFDTSGMGEHGPRWRPYPRSAAGFKVRHPGGL